MHDHLIEHKCLRNPPHVNEPVDDDAIAVKRKLAWVFERERYGTEVDIRSKAPIQMNLFSSVRRARRKRRQVLDLVPDRLFELVDLISRQKDP